MRSTLALFGFAMLTVAGLGCTPRKLVHDELVRPSDIPEAHCRGSEWTNESSVAAVPVPFVAFFSPQIDLRRVEAEDYLSRCGDSRHLVNRDVSVDRSACGVPATLTRILTTGIYQWCPSHVDWSADVVS